MDVDRKNLERKIIINQRGTLPGMGTPRPPIVPRSSFPEISIEELERDLADEEAFEEFETSETIEMPVPKVPADDELEGPTGTYEIQRSNAAGEVYWVQRV